MSSKPTTLTSQYHKKNLICSSSTRRRNTLVKLAPLGSTVQTMHESDKSFEAKNTWIDNILVSNNVTECSKVTSIDLRGTKLSRIKNLDIFPQVVSLDLSSNLLSKLEGLQINKNLKELKLYDNKISIIESLDSQVKLEVLHLQFNIIENIGTGLRSLRCLKVLRLDNNKISSLSSQELMPLSKQLTTLDISNNILEDISAITILKEIEDLNMSNNKLKTLPAMKVLPKLSELDLSSNEISNLKALEECYALVTLKAARNNLKDKSFVEIETCFENLDYLDIAFNNLLKIVHLPRLVPNVNVMDLSFNKLTNVDGLELNGFLHELHLKGNPIKISMDLVAASLPKLQLLDGKPLTGLDFIPTSANNLHPIGSIMEQQMQEFETQLCFQYEDIFSKFKIIKTAMDSDLSMEDEDNPRPSSKCRSRIEDAKKFSSLNYK